MDLDNSHHLLVLTNYLYLNYMILYSVTVLNLHDKPNFVNIMFDI